jgi:hypothetical protein
VEEAQEGVFDMRLCGVAFGRQLVNNIIQGRMSEAELSDRITSATFRTRAKAPTSAILRNAATSF